MKTTLFHLHALSPVHVGVGQATGALDLPIMREKSTHLPLVPGSAIKGVLRDAIQRKDGELAGKLFGPATIAEADDAHIGAIAFGDALLLALPVRSLGGIVALVTSPFLLERYANLAARNGVKLPAIPAVAKEGSALVPENSVNTIEQAKQKSVVLEDLDLEASVSADATAWAKTLSPLAGESADHVKRRLVVVHDAVMGFLADTGTEIRARIRIDNDKGTVEKGALWYEENLPAESLLAGLLAFDHVKHKQKGWALDPEDAHAELKKALGDEITLQVGGKATVGRGLVRMILAAREG